MNYAYTILGNSGTVQAVHADVTLANQLVTIGAGTSDVTLQKLLRFLNISSVSAVATWAPVTQVLQIDTITFTAVVGTVYTINLRQLNLALGTYYDTGVTLTYTGVAGDTATTIGDKFRSMINALTAAGALQIAATGTTTLIMTAITRYPIFKTTILSGAASIALVLTLAGVRSVGFQADLLLAGVSAADATAASYQTIVINYGSVEVPLQEMNRTRENQLTLYVNQAATNRAALITYLGEMFASLVAGGAAYDPEVTALV